MLEGHNVPPVLITLYTTGLQQAMMEAQAIQHAVGGDRQAEIKENASVDELKVCLRGRRCWFFLGHSGIWLNRERVPIFDRQVVSLLALVDIIGLEVERGHLTWVVLNGCNTSQLGSALRQDAHVPFVVCWETMVDDHAAHKFGHRLAAEITSNADADLAFRSARTAVTDVTESGHTDAGHPMYVQRYEFVDPSDRALVYPLQPPVERKHCGRLRNYQPGAGRGRVAAGVPCLHLPDEAMLHNVPPLPRSLVQRPEQSEMREAIICRGRRAGAILGLVGGQARGQRNGVGGGGSVEVIDEAAGEGGLRGIAGTAGLGKTTMAIWLARDPRVRAAFHDGVFWLEFGYDRTSEELLLQLARWLGIEFAADEVRTRERAGLLDRVILGLRGKRCLLILDDIWNQDQPLLFQKVVQSLTGTVALMTTRNAQIVDLFGQGLVRLELAPLDDDAAKRLLISVRGDPRPSPEQLLPAEHLDALIKLCGGLPAMLRSVGRMCSRQTARQVLSFFAAHRQELRLATGMAASDHYRILDAKGNLFLALEGHLHGLAEEERRESSRIFGESSGIFAAEEERRRHPPSFARPVTAAAAIVAIAVCAATTQLQVPRRVPLSAMAAATVATALSALACLSMPGMAHQAAKKRSFRTPSSLCTMLGVFPEDTDVPRAVIQGLWETTDAETVEVIEKLLTEHLIQRRAGDCLGLTDPVRDYLRVRGKSRLSEWNLALLRGCTVSSIGGDNRGGRRREAEGSEAEGSGYWLEQRSFAAHLEGVRSPLVGRLSGALSSVTKLNLEACGFGDEAVEKLAAALQAGAFANLGELVLMENELLDRGVVALAQAVEDNCLRHLMRLLIGFNRIGDKAVSRLAEAMQRARPPPPLKIMSFSSNCIGDEGICALLDAASCGALGALEELYLDAQQAVVGMASTGSLVSSLTARQMPVLRVVAVPTEMEQHAPLIDCCRKQGVQLR